MDARDDALAARQTPGARSPPPGGVRELEDAGDFGEALAFAGASRVADDAGVQAGGMPSRTDSGVRAGAHSIPE